MACFQFVVASDGLSAMNITGCPPRSETGIDRCDPLAGMPPTFGARRQAGPVRLSPARYLTRHPARYLARYLARIAKRSVSWLETISNQRPDIIRSPIPRSRTFSTSIA